jgi:hypothetical protein
MGVGQGAGGMVSTRSVFITAVSALVLAGCGGGSSNSSSDNGSNGGGPGAPTNASVGGIWNGTDPVSGLQLVGLIDEAGEFHFIRSDGVQYVGTATTNGNSVSASFDGYTQFGSTFADGSTSGVGSLSGTVQQRVSITANTQFKTTAGTTASGTLSLTFNSLYDNPSSLSTISGNYTDQSSGDVISVTSSGVVSWQDPSSGCVGNGTISIIDTSYNAYRVEFDYGDCQGQAAVLNGVQFSGLATLNTSVSPEQVIVGVTGQASGTTYAAVFTLNRS